MDAELEARSRITVAPDRHAITVELEPRASEQVALRVARDAFDRQLRSRGERRRIDHRQQASAYGRVLRDRFRRIRRTDARVDHLVGPWAGDAQREPMQSTRIDAQATHDPSRT